MAKLEIDIKPQHQDRIQRLASLYNMSPEEYLAMRVADLFDLDTTDEKRQAGIKPIWDVLAEASRQIPKEERLPHDFAVNHDHYIYGASKIEG